MADLESTSGSTPSGTGEAEGVVTDATDAQVGNEGEADWFIASDVFTRAVAAGYAPEGSADALAAKAAPDEKFVQNANDYYYYSSSDGLDRITDFGVGDRLDLSAYVNIDSPEEIAAVVRLEPTAAGTMISVADDYFDTWSNVVLLENTDVTLDELVDNGQIIVGT